jgi:hypothetical protein
MRWAAGGIVLAIVVMLTIAAVRDGGKSSDPTSQIRSNYHEFFTALKANNIARMCSLSTNVGDCLGKFAMAKAFLGTGKVSDLVFAHDLSVIGKGIDTWPVHVAPNNRQATVRESCAGQSSKCAPQTDKWVKADGDWKLVLQSN